MMANTDPEYVSLLFDSGHFAYCGEDPVAMVEKYVGRIKHVHLKDIRSEIVKKSKRRKDELPGRGTGRCIHHSRRRLCEL